MKSGQNFHSGPSFATFILINIIKIVKETQQDFEINKFFIFVTLR